LRALVPKGYFIDRFPTESSTASEIQAREVEASRKVLQDQVTALEAQAQALINKRMNFFAPHFGLKPQKGIADTYLLDEQGNWKGVSTGAAANSIANEIMLYKSPAPSDVKLTQVETVGLIMNMIKRYELTNQINSMGAQRTSDDIKEFYSLKRRPTYEEFKATLDALKATSWGKQGIPQGQGKYSAVTLTNIFGYGYWVSSYQPSNYETSNSFLKVANHPSGFKAIPAHVLNFYEGAYKVGKPQSFWQYCSQYRVGLTAPPSRNRAGQIKGVPGDLAGKVCVALYRVDPFTGAPTKKVAIEDVVAYGVPGTESSLLATVKGALFPEVYTLEAGVNYQVGDAKVRYRNELQTALNMWNGVADKLNTPLVTIASQDGPVTKIAVYLQPTGIEDAMAKLVKGDPFQAWFDSMLGTKAQVANDLPKKMLTSQITESDWRTGYTVRFRNAIDRLEDAMTHPGTYIGGISHVLNLSVQSQSRTDLSTLLTSVQWPMGIPTKMFEVYVDDTRDANIVINTLFTYLEEESLMKPPEMYFAEAIQARLEWDEYVPPKNPNVQQGGQAPQAGKTYNYEVVRKINMPLRHKYTRIESYPVSPPPPGANGTLRRYFTAGKTVVSKRTVSGPGSSFLKEATQLREVENRVTPMSVQMGSMPQEEVNLLIGVGAVALIGGILLFKR